MPSPSPRSSVRRRLLAGGIGAIICAVVASASFAATSRTIVISDPGGDVSGPLDLTRVSLQRASDGRLRAVVTFAEKITPKTLLATSGPPGAACLRIWTGRDADPRAMRPDRLVCVTARADDELRGGVYEVSGSALPERLADASVKLIPSGRSVVVRFAQRSLGRPQRIRFGFESTRAGCERPSCIDTVPGKGATRSFRLR
ncbi:MAG: hypothetical protein M3N04_01530 [Actinomycetota bacterium]|nr:hypothetical protein [Actinomycetota bacterium]